MATADTKKPLVQKPLAPRGAHFESHWNDPPHVIFQKNASINNKEIQEDGNFVLEILKSSLNSLRENKIQTRILDDTEKRLSLLFTSIEKGELKPELTTSLSEFSKAIKSGDYTKANDVVTQLMVGPDFATDGRWILGLRRLLDLCKEKRIEG
ncbi:uncharacterized protein VTP21DRAFT_1006 [Calcarisporiella thermophila]|uniref:uncharacterized protein n=1 Tax=Calcarisporiella thermophila TaxID=911321 RepID=UPI0037438BC4